MVIQGRWSWRVALEQGRDGLVAYDSAHVTPVESELVVRSGHSVQDNPACIEDIRRILLEHAATGS